MPGYFLLACLMTALQVKAVPTDAGFHELPDPPHPTWMQSDAALQVPVTLEAKGRPLNVVLSALSKNSGVDIDAARDIGQYRVAIYANKQPLWKIMTRLQDVFGHGKLPNNGYEWRRIVAGKSPPHYFLLRNAHGRAEEEAQLDYPRTTALRWLKDIRTYVRLAPKDRKKFVTDYPSLKYCIARGLDFDNDTDQLPVHVIGSLTDPQFTALIQQEELVVPQYMLSDTSIVWLRQEVPSGSGVLPGTDETIPPSGATLRIEQPEVRDALQGIYTMSLVFQHGFPPSCPGSYVFDTLNVLEMEEKQEPTKPDQGAGEKIDLLAHENAPTGTSPTMTLPIALSLLAHEAKISLYSETFLKSKHTLKITKGKPEYLLSRICEEFGYRWCKVGGDYVVYDKMWALDRDADISQLLLERLTRTLQKQKGVFNVSDVIDMAQNLRDRQIGKVAWLFDNDGLRAPRDLVLLHFMATLSPGDLHASFRTGGLVLTQLTEAQTRLLQQILNKNKIALPLQIISDDGTAPLPNSAAFDIYIRDASGTKRGMRIFLGRRTDAPIVVEPR